MNYFIRVFILVLVSAAVSVNASASTIEALINDGKLIVNVEVISKAPLVAKQPVKISVELLTDRWFGEGNRIRDFEVENTVKLPLDSQAINGSVKRNGQSWVIQTREITLFPLDAGIYDLPALTVDVAINTPSGIVKGSTVTPAVSFEVDLPNELQTIDQYVVSDEFKVTSEGLFDDSEPYKIGEAVTLTILMTAKGIPAMMLPTLPNVDIEGVSIYRKKPNLSEKANRGQLTSLREEQLNFIFEQSGNYFLPEMTFYWWDLSKQSLETISLPAQRWQVSNEILENKAELSTKNWLWLKDVQLSTLLFSALTLLLSLWLMYVAVKYRQCVASYYLKVTHYESRVLKAEYIKAIKAKNYRQACQILYRLMSKLMPTAGGHYSEMPKVLAQFYSTNEEQKQIIDALLIAGFGEQPQPIKISISDAKKLINFQSVTSKKSSLFIIEEKIEVNPK